MHPDRTQGEARRLLALGVPAREVSERLDVPRRTVSDWARPGTHPSRPSSCPRCDQAPLPEAAYAELLGWYLGDGHLVPTRRGTWVLRVVNDVVYPDLNRRVGHLLVAVRRGGRSGVQERPGCVVTSMSWKHWACLFPQHGPGRKHERPIVLEAWQRAVVERHPAAFLRGLFHSDGSRVRNWATRVVDGEVRRHDYPRWQFTNSSEDILGLCSWALDLVEVPWRRSSRTHVSVSTRAGVARLDDLIGLKS